MRTKVRVVIVADIDLDEYRRHYGQPETSAEQIKNAVRADILDAARSAHPASPIVRIAQAVR
jgi:hypothetical protein